MGPAERRSAILKLLCRTRFETIANLSSWFEVSERTIRRDIEILSLTEPIFTKSGRYGGGVYVTDNYSIDRIYFKGRELEILNTLLKSVESHKICELTNDEIVIFKNLIREYTKPQK